MPARSEKTLKDDVTSALEELIKAGDVEMSTDSEGKTLYKLTPQGKAFAKVLVGNVVGAS